MNKEGWLLITCFVVIFSSNSNNVVSQDAIFSQFYANPLYLNPAFAGVQLCPSLNFNYRNHPYPDFGHLSTYSASYNQYWEPVSGGLGLLVLSEHLGQMLRRNFMGGIYSYHTRLTQELHLNFGVNAAYYRKDLHWDNLVFPDQYDPFTGNINQTREIPPEDTQIGDLDISTGMLLYSDNFFAGIAGSHLTRPRESLYTNHRLPIKLTLHGGSKFKINSYSKNLRDIYFSPNIIMQHQGEFLRINYGAYFDFEPVTTGVWLRQDFEDQKTLIFLFGLYQENYRVGYSFDYSLSGFYPGNTGIHEISVSLNFGCERQKDEYKILNCPNF